MAAPPRDPARGLRTPPDTRGSLRLVCLTGDCAERLSRLLRLDDAALSSSSAIAELIALNVQLSVILLNMGRCVPRRYNKKTHLWSLLIKYWIMDKRLRLYLSYVTRRSWRFLIDTNKLNGKGRQVSMLYESFFELFYYCIIFVSRMLSVFSDNFNDEDASYEKTDTGTFSLFLINKELVKIISTIFCANGYENCIVPDIPQIYENFEEARELFDKKGYCLVGVFTTIPADFCTMSSKYTCSSKLSQTYCILMDLLVLSLRKSFRNIHWDVCETRRSSSVEQSQLQCLEGKLSRELKRQNIAYPTESPLRKNNITFFETTPDCRSASPNNREKCNNKGKHSKQRIFKHKFDKIRQSYDKVMSNFRKMEVHLERIIEDKKIDERDSMFKTSNVNEELNEEDILMKNEDVETITKSFMSRLNSPENSIGTESEDSFVYAAGGDEEDNYISNNKNESVQLDLKGNKPGTPESSNLNSELTQLNILKFILKHSDECIFYNYLGNDEGYWVELDGYKKKKKLDWKCIKRHNYVYIPGGKELSFEFLLIFSNLFPLMNAIVCSSNLDGKDISTFSKSVILFLEDNFQRINSNKLNSRNHIMMENFESLFIETCCIKNPTDTNDFQNIDNEELDYNIKIHDMLRDLMIFVKNLLHSSEKFKKQFDPEIVNPNYRSSMSMSKESFSVTQKHHDIKLSSVTPGTITYSNIMLFFCRLYLFYGVDIFTSYSKLENLYYPTLIKTDIIHNSITKELAHYYDKFPDKTSLNLLVSDMILAKKHIGPIGLFNSYLLSYDLEGFTEEKINEAKSENSKFQSPPFDEICLKTYNKIQKGMKLEQFIKQKEKNLEENNNDIISLTHNDLVVSFENDFFLFCKNVLCTDLGIFLNTFDLKSVFNQYLSIMSFLESIIGSNMYYYDDNVAFILSFCRNKKAKDNKKDRNFKNKVYVRNSKRLEDIDFNKFSDKYRESNPVFLEQFNVDQIFNKDRQFITNSMMDDSSNPFSESVQHVFDTNTRKIIIDSIMVNVVRLEENFKTEENHVGFNDITNECFTSKNINILLKVIFSRFFRLSLFLDKLYPNPKLLNLEVTNFITYKNLIDGEFHSNIAKRQQNWLSKVSNNFYSHLNVKDLVLSSQLNSNRPSDYDPLIVGRYKNTNIHSRNKFMLDNILNKSFLFEDCSHKIFVKMFNKRYGIDGRILRNYIETPSIPHIRMTVNNKESYWMFFKDMIKFQGTLFNIITMNILVEIILFQSSGMSNSRSQISSKGSLITENSLLSKNQYGKKRSRFQNIYCYDSDDDGDITNGRNGCISGNDNEHIEINIDNFIELCTIITKLLPQILVEVNSGTFVQLAQKSGFYTRAHEKANNLFGEDYHFVHINYNTENSLCGLLNFDRYVRFNEYQKLLENSNSANTHFSNTSDPVNIRTGLKKEGSKYRGDQSMKLNGNRKLNEERINIGGAPSYSEWTFVVPEKLKNLLSCVPSLMLELYERSLDELLRVDESQSLSYFQKNGEEPKNSIENMVEGINTKIAHFLSLMISLSVTSIDCSSVSGLALMENEKGAISDESEKHLNRYGIRSIDEIYRKFGRKFRRHIANFEHLIVDKLYNNPFFGKSLKDANFRVHSLPQYLNAVPLNSKLYPSTAEILNTFQKNSNCSTRSPSTDKKEEQQFSSSTGLNTDILNPQFNNGQILCTSNKFCVDIIKADKTVLLDAIGDLFYKFVWDSCDLDNLYNGFLDGEFHNKEADVINAFNGNINIGNTSNESANFGSIPLSSTTAGNQGEAKMTENVVNNASLERKNMDRKYTAKTIANALLKTKLNRFDYSITLIYLFKQQRLENMIQQLYNVVIEVLFDLLTLVVANELKVYYDTERYLLDQEDFPEDSSSEVDTHIFENRNEKTYCKLTCFFDVRESYSFINQYLVLKLLKLILPPLNSSSSNTTIMSYASANHKMNQIKRNGMSLFNYNYKMKDSNIAQETNRDNQNQKRIEFLEAGRELAKELIQVKNRIFSFINNKLNSRHTYFELPNKSLEVLLMSSYRNKLISCTYPNDTYQNVDDDNLLKGKQRMYPDDIWNMFTNEGVSLEESIKLRIEVLYTLYSIKAKKQFDCNKLTSTKNINFDFNNISIYAKNLLNVCRNNLINYKHIQQPDYYACYRKDFDIFSGNVKLNLGFPEYTNGDAIESINRMIEAHTSDFGDVKDEDVCSVSDVNKEYISIQDAYYQLRSSDILEEFINSIEVPVVSYISKSSVGTNKSSVGAEEFDSSSIDDEGKSSSKSVGFGGKKSKYNSEKSTRFNVGNNNVSDSAVNNSNSQQTEDNSLTQMFSLYLANSMINYGALSGIVCKCIYDIIKWQSIFDPVATSFGAAVSQLLISKLLFHKNITSLVAENNSIKDVILAIKKQRYCFRPNVRIESEIIPRQILTDKIDKMVELIGADNCIPDMPYIDKVTPKLLELRFIFSALFEGGIKINGIPVCCNNGEYEISIPQEFCQKRQKRNDPKLFNPYEHIDNSNELMRVIYATSTNETSCVNNSGVAGKNLSNKEEEFDRDITSVFTNMQTYLSYVAKPEYQLVLLTKTRISDLLDSASYIEPIKNNHTNKKVLSLLCKLMGSFVFSERLKKELIKGWIYRRILLTNMKNVNKEFFPAHMQDRFLNEIEIMSDLRIKSSITQNNQNTITSLNYAYQTPTTSINTSIYFCEGIILARRGVLNRFLDLINRFLVSFHILNISDLLMRRYQIENVNLISGNVFLTYLNKYIEILMSANIGDFKSVKKTMHKMNSNSSQLQTSSFLESLFKTITKQLLPYINILNSNPTIHSEAATKENSLNDETIKKKRKFMKKKDKVVLSNVNTSNTRLKKQEILIQDIEAFYLVKNVQLSIITNLLTIIKRLISSFVIPAKIPFLQNYFGSLVINKMADELYKKESKSYKNLAEYQEPFHLEYDLVRVVVNAPAPIPSYLSIVKDKSNSYFSLIATTPTQSLFEFDENYVLNGEKLNNEHLLSRILVVSKGENKDLKVYIAIPNGKSMNDIAKIITSFFQLGVEMLGKDQEISDLYSVSVGKYGQAMNSKKFFQYNIITGGTFRISDEDEASTNLDILDVPLQLFVRVYQLTLTEFESLFVNKPSVSSILLSDMFVRHDSDEFLNLFITYHDISSLSKCKNSSDKILRTENNDLPPIIDRILSLCSKCEQGKVDSSPNFTKYYEFCFLLMNKVIDTDPVYTNDKGLDLIRYHTDTELLMDCLQATLNVYPPNSNLFLKAINIVLDANKNEICKKTPKSIGMRTRLEESEFFYFLLMFIDPFTIKFLSSPSRKNVNKRDSDRKDSRRSKDYKSYDFLDEIVINGLEQKDVKNILNSSSYEAFLNDYLASLSNSFMSNILCKNGIDTNLKQEEQLLFAFEIIVKFVFRGDNALKYSHIWLKFFENGMEKKMCDSKDEKDGNSISNDSNSWVDLCCVIAKWLIYTVRTTGFIHNKIKLASQQIQRILDFVINEIMEKSKNYLDKLKELYNILNFDRFFIQSFRDISFKIFDTLSNEGHIKLDSDLNYGLYLMVDEFLNNSIINILKLFFIDSRVIYNCEYHQDRNVKSSVVSNIDTICIFLDFVLSILKGKPPTDSLLFVKSLVKNTLVTLSSFIDVILLLYAENISPNSNSIVQMIKSLFEKMNVSVENSLSKGKKRFSYSIPTDFYDNHRASCLQDSVKRRTLKRIFHCLFEKYFLVLNTTLSKYYPEDIVLSNSENHSKFLLEEETRLIIKTSINIAHSEFTDRDVISSIVSLFAVFMKHYGECCSNNKVYPQLLNCFKEDGNISILLETLLGGNTLKEIAESHSFAVNIVQLYHFRDHNTYQFLFSALCLLESPRLRGIITGKPNKFLGTETLKEFGLAYDYSVARILLLNLCRSLNRNKYSINAYRNKMGQKLREIHLDSKNSNPHYMDIEKTDPSMILKNRIQVELVGILENFPTLSEVDIYYDIVCNNELRVFKGTFNYLSIPLSPSVVMSVNEILNGSGFNIVNPHKKKKPRFIVGKIICNLPKILVLMPKMTFYDKYIYIKPKNSSRPVFYNNLSTLDDENDSVQNYIFSQVSNCIKSLINMSVELSFTVSGFSQNSVYQYTFASGTFKIISTLRTSCVCNLIYDDECDLFKVFVRNDQNIDNKNSKDLSNEKKHRNKNITGNTLGRLIFSTNNKNSYVSNVARVLVDSGICERYEVITLMYTRTKHRNISRETLNPLEITQKKYSVDKKREKILKYNKQIGFVSNSIKNIELLTDKEVSSLFDKLLPILNMTDETYKSYDDYLSSGNIRKLVHYFILREFTISPLIGGTKDNRQIFQAIERLIGADTNGVLIKDIFSVFDRRQLRNDTIILVIKHLIKHLVCGSYDSDGSRHEVTYAYLAKKYEHYIEGAQMEGEESIDSKKAYGNKYDQVNNRLNFMCFLLDKDYKNKGAFERAKHFISIIQEIYEECFYVAISEDDDKRRNKYKNKGKEKENEMDNVDKNKRNKNGDKVDTYTTLSKLMSNEVSRGADYMASLSLLVFINALLTNNESNVVGSVKLTCFAKYLIKLGWIEKLTEDLVMWDRAYQQSISRSDGRENDIVTETEHDMEVEEEKSGSYKNKNRKPHSINECILANSLICSQYILLVLRLVYYEINRNSTHHWQRIQPAFWDVLGRVNLGGLEQGQTFILLYIFDLLIYKPRSSEKYNRASLKLIRYISDSAIQHIFIRHPNNDINELERYMNYSSEKLKNGLHNDGTENQQEQSVFYQKTLRFINPQYKIFVQHKYYNLVKLFVILFISSRFLNQKALLIFQQMGKRLFNQMTIIIDEKEGEGRKHSLLEDGFMDGIEEKRSSLGKEKEGSEIITKISKRTMSVSQQDLDNKSLDILYYFLYINNYFKDAFINKPSRFLPFLIANNRDFQLVIYNCFCISYGIYEETSPEMSSVVVEIPEWEKNAGRGQTGSNKMEVQEVQDKQLYDYKIYKLREQEMNKMSALSFSECITTTGETARGIPPLSPTAEKSPKKEREEMRSDEGNDKLEIGDIENHSNKIIVDNGIRPKARYKRYLMMQFRFESYIEHHQIIRGIITKSRELKNRWYSTVCHYSLCSKIRHMLSDIPHLLLPYLVPNPIGILYERSLNNSESFDVTPQDAKRTNENKLVCLLRLVINCIKNESVFYSAQRELSEIALLLSDKLIPLMASYWPRRFSDEISACGYNRTAIATRNSNNKDIHYTVKILYLILVLRNGFSIIENTHNIREKETGLAHKLLREDIRNRYPESIVLNLISLTANMDVVIYNSRCVKPGSHNHYKNKTLKYINTIIYRSLLYLRQIEKKKVFQNNSYTTILEDLFRPIPINCKGIIEAAINPNHSQSNFYSQTASNNDINLLMSSNLSVKSRNTKNEHISGHYKFFKIKLRNRIYHTRDCRYTHILHILGNNKEYIDFAYNYSIVSSDFTNQFKKLLPGSTYVIPTRMLNEPNYHFHYNFKIVSKIIEKNRSFMLATYLGRGNIVDCKNGYIVVDTLRNRTKRSESSSYLLSQVEGLSFLFKLYPSTNKYNMRTSLMLVQPVLRMLSIPLIDNIRSLLHNHINEKVCVYSTQQQQQKFIEELKGLSVSTKNTNPSFYNTNIILRTSNDLVWDSYNLNQQIYNKTLLGLTQTKKSLPNLFNIEMAKLMNEMNIDGLDSCLLLLSSLPEYVLLKVQLCIGEISELYTKYNKFIIKREYFNTEENEELERKQIETSSKMCIENDKFTSTKESETKFGENENSETTILSNDTQEEGITEDGNNNGDVQDSAMGDFGSSHDDDKTGDNRNIKLDLKSLTSNSQNKMKINDSKLNYTDEDEIGENVPPLKRFVMSRQLENNIPRIQNIISFCIESLRLVYSILKKATDYVNPSFKGCIPEGFHSFEGIVRQKIMILNNYIMITFKPIIQCSTLFEYMNNDELNEYEYMDTRFKTFGRDYNSTQGFSSMSETSIDFSVANQSFSSKVPSFIANTDYKYANETARLKRQYYQSFTKKSSSECNVLKMGNSFSSSTFNDEMFSPSVSLQYGSSPTGSIMSPNAFSYHSPSSSFTNPDPFISSACVYNEMKPNNKRVENAYNKLGRLRASIIELRYCFVDLIYFNSKLGPDIDIGSDKFYRLNYPLAPLGAYEYGSGSVDEISKFYSCTLKDMVINYRSCYPLYPNNALPVYFMLPISIINRTFGLPYCSLTSKYEYSLYTILYTLITLPDMTSQIASYFDTFKQVSRSQGSSIETDVHSLWDRSTDISMRRIPVELINSVVSILKKALELHIEHFGGYKIIKKLPHKNDKVLYTLDHLMCSSMYREQTAVYSKIPEEDLEVKKKVMNTNIPVLNLLCSKVENYLEEYSKKKPVYNNKNGIYDDPSSVYSMTVMKTNFIPILNSLNLPIYRSTRMSTGLQHEMDKPPIKRTSSLFQTKYWLIDPDNSGDYGFTDIRDDFVSQNVFRMRSGMTGNNNSNIGFNNSGRSINKEDIYRERMVQQENDVYSEGTGVNLARLTPLAFNLLSLINGKLIEMVLCITASITSALTNDSSLTDRAYINSLDIASLFKLFIRFLTTVTYEMIVYKHFEKKGAKDMFLKASSDRSVDYDNVRNKKYMTSLLSKYHTRCICIECSLLSSINSYFSILLNKKIKTFCSEHNKFIQESSIMIQSGESNSPNYNSNIKFRDEFSNSVKYEGENKKVTKKILNKQTLVKHEKDGTNGPKELKSIGSSNNDITEKSQVSSPTQLFGKYNPELSFLHLMSYSINTLKEISASTIIRNIHSIVLNNCLNEKKLHEKKRNLFYKSNSETIEMTSHSLLISLLNNAKSLYRLTSGLSSKDNYETPDSVSEWVRTFAIIADMITQRDMHWKLILQAAVAKDFKNRCKNTVCSPPEIYITNFGMNIDNAINNLKTIEAKVSLYDFPTIYQILKRLKF